MHDFLSIYLFSNLWTVLLHQAASSPEKTLSSSLLFPQRLGQSQYIQPTQSWSVKWMNGFLKYALIEHSKAVVKNKWDHTMQIWMVTIISIIHVSTEINLAEDSTSQHQSVLPGWLFPALSEQQPPSKRSRFHHTLHRDHLQSSYLD